MTRKDYILIAAALVGARDSLATVAYGDAPAADGWALAACSIADALQSDNPRFDRARFLKAAGVTE